MGGSTTSLDEIDNVVCETDVDALDQTVYTKIDLRECGSDTVEMILYDCEDSNCAVCTETIEGGGKVQTSTLKEAYSTVETCITWSGGLAKPQVFDSSNVLSSSQAYWLALLENTCGKKWFEDNINAATSIATTNSTESPASPVANPEELDRSNAARFMTNSDLLNVIAGFIFVLM